MSWRSGSKIKIAVGMIGVCLLAGAALLYRQPLFDNVVAFRQELSQWHTLYKENEKWKKVLKNAAIDNMKSVQLQFQNKQLEQAYEVMQRLPATHSYSMANIIRLTPARTGIEIDLGKLDGIQKNDPVLSLEQNFVGIVSEITDHTSIIQLINTTEFLTNQGISVTVRGREATMGILEYDLSANSPIVDKIPEDQIIQAGDVIETIGGDLSKYPAGLRIGTVSEVSAGSLGISVQASLTIPEFPKPNESMVIIVHSSSNP